MLRLIAAALALSAGMAAAEDIKVGVTPGEHAEIMEQIVPLAAAKGLNIDVIEFSDYVVPNTALANSSSVRRGICTSMWRSSHGQLAIA